MSKGSELKRFDVYVYGDRTPSTREYCDDGECYDADEVDALIAEKDAENAQQKYKRCLDKAKWCFTKSNYHFVLARHGEDGKENSRKAVLYTKWHKRWLELAKKFKEAT